MEGKTENRKDKYNDMRICGNYKMCEKITRLFPIRTNVIFPSKQLGTVIR